MPLKQIGAQQQGLMLVQFYCLWVLLALFVCNCCTRLVFILLYIYCFLKCVLVIWLIDWPDWPWSHTLRHCRVMCMVKCLLETSVREQVGFNAAREKHRKRSNNVCVLQHRSRKIDQTYFLVLGAGMRLIIHCNDLCRAEVETRKIEFSSYLYLCWHVDILLLDLFP